MLGKKKRGQGNLPENSREQNTGARPIWCSLVVRVIKDHVYNTWLRFAVLHLSGKDWKINSCCYYIYNYNNYYYYWFIDCFIIVFTIKPENNDKNNNNVNELSSWKSCEQFNNFSLIFSVTSWLVILLSDWLV